jgi:hypothetical protein
MIRHKKAHTELLQLPTVGSKLDHRNAVIRLAALAPRLR